MKIVAFLAVVHILLLSSAAEGRRHNFRGAEDERELKKKKSKKKSGSAAGGGNRVAPACMMAVPPNCVTWPLDEEAVNRATGNQIPGYTLSETVINPVDGALYRVYVPDSDIQPVLPPDDSLSDLNRVPTGENDGGELDGGGQLDRVFGSSTTRTGSCSKSIKNIGAALPENCKQGEDCESGICAVSSQVVNGVCVAEVPKGWARLPAIVSCVNK